MSKQANIDVEEFKQLLEEKRHKQIIDILTKIYMSTESKSEFPIEEIKELISKYEPNASITSILNVISEKLDMLKSISEQAKSDKKENWLFTVAERDFSGNISKVVAQEI